MNCSASIKMSLRCHIHLRRDRKLKRKYQIVLKESQAKERAKKQTNLPSHKSQYLRGGGSFLSLSFDIKLTVELISGRFIGGGLSDDCSGQSSVSCASNSSQMSQNRRGAGFRLTGKSNKPLLERRKEQRLDTVSVEIKKRLERLT